MTSNPDSDCLSLPGFSEETEESSLRSRELVKGRKGAGGGGAQNQWGRQREEKVPRRVRKESGPIVEEP